MTIVTRFVERSTLMLDLRNKQNKTILCIFMDKVIEAENNNKNDLSAVLISSALLVAQHPRSMFYSMDHKIKNFFLARWKNIFNARSMSAQEISDELLKSWVIIYYRASHSHYFGSHIFLQTFQYLINLYQRNDGSIVLHDDILRAKESFDDKIILFSLDVAAIETRYKQILLPAFLAHKIAYSIAIQDRDNPRTYSCANLTLDLLNIGGIKKLYPELNKLLNCQIVEPSEVYELAKTAKVNEEQLHESIDQLGFKTPTIINQKLHFMRQNSSHDLQSDTSNKSVAINIAKKVFNFFNSTNYRR